ncbi:NUDIX domain-containing protein [Candidatus Woesearchaeota archaeon]|nr:NUDIX domain-containing protein [Candidatus Woesearchaeota archaeon]
MHIPDSLYKEILENMPIVCVDVLVEHEGSVLLLKRNNEPARGQWFPPGGRLLKNESPIAAAQRICKRETGNTIVVEKQVGTYNTTWEKGPFALKTGVHSVNIVFLARAKNKEVKLDKTSTEYHWVNKMPKLHPYVKKIIADAGVLHENSKTIRTE